MNKFLKKIGKTCCLGLTLCSCLFANVRAVPHLIFGTWQTENRTKELVVHAIRNGIRHIDTAQSYGNEHMVGAAVRQCIQEGIIKRREDIEITTKIIPSEVDEIARKNSCMYHQAIEYLISESLKSLNTKYIDTILIHEADSDNISEIWNSLAILKKQHPNVIKKIGVSNFVYEFDVDKLSDIKPDVVQNLFLPGMESKMPYYYDWKSELSSKESLQLESYKPLGHGQLLRNDKIKELAEKYGVSAADICLQYYLQNGISPVFSSTNFEHITQNSSSSKLFLLKAEDIRDIESIFDFNTFFSILFS